MNISNEKKRISDLINPILHANSQNKTFSIDTASVMLEVDSESTDDCAVYNVSGDFSLVAGSDYVRGVGFTLFQLGRLDFFDLGYYLIIANLSDVAAMGATPIGLLTVIRYPSSLSDEDFAEIHKGIRAAAGEYNTPIIGGDIGGSKELILSASALGICARDKALLRKGTVDGDLICVSGNVGVPAAALVYFTKYDAIEKKLSAGEEQALLNSWKKPTAQVHLGTILSQSSIGIICQDISDGLKTTLEEISQINNVGVLVDESKLPVSPEVRKVAEIFGLDSTALALSASVDFELLFTIKRENLNELRHLLGDQQEVFVIGEIISDNKCLLRRESGTIENIPGTTWKHENINPVEDIINQSTNKD